MTCLSRYGGEGDGGTDPTHLQAGARRRLVVAPGSGRFTHWEKLHRKLDGPCSLSGRHRKYRPQWDSIPVASRYTGRRLYSDFITFQTVFHPLFPSHALMDATPQPNFPSSVADVQAWQYINLSTSASIRDTHVRLGLINLTCLLLVIHIQSGTKSRDTECLLLIIEIQVTLVSACTLVW
jgi:hypothetical protein